MPPSSRFARLYVQNVTALLERSFSQMMDLQYVAYRTARGLFPCHIRSSLIYTHTRELIQVN